MTNCRINRLAFWAFLFCTTALTSVAVAAPLPLRGPDLPFDGKDSVAEQAPAASKPDLALPDGLSPDGVAPDKMPPADAPPSYGPARDRLEPVDLGKPVKALPLGAIDQDSTGLITQASGGLGAQIWKKTPRALVDKMLADVELPLTSPTLNDLARRLLASTSDAPQGKPAQPAPGQTEQSLTELRIGALLRLGASDDAWRFAGLVRPEKINDALWLDLVLSRLLPKDAKEACDKIPSLIAAHGKLENPSTAWQKRQILCHIKRGDMAAAQLGMDLLREEDAAHDAFSAIVFDNLLAGSNNLPAAAHALDVMGLAVMRLADMAVPPAYYGAAPAWALPELLAAPGADESQRLAAGERAARAGLISADRLAFLYKVPVFSAEEKAASSTGVASDPRTRARLAQAFWDATDPVTQAQKLDRWIAGFGAEPVQGSLAILLADAVARIQPAPDVAFLAPKAVRVLLMAGKDAGSWLPFLAPGSLDKPLMILAGNADEATQGRDLQEWLTAYLARADTTQTRARAESILALLSAVGVPLPEDMVLRLIGSPMAVQTGKDETSPLLTGRLAGAADKNRKGEAVLLALALAGQQKPARTTAIVAQALRSLRGAGLEAEAKAWAREEIAALLPPLDP